MMTQAICPEFSMNMQVLEVSCDSSVTFKNMVKLKK